MTSQSRNIRHDTGFTLIEALVALAIFAAAAAWFYRGIDAGARGVRLATLDAAAVSVAKSRLAAAGVEQPLAAGTTSGTSADGLAWTTSITAHDAGTAEFESDQAAPQLYRIDVAVTWRETPGRPLRTLTLTTLRNVVMP